MSECKAQVVVRLSLFVAALVAFRGTTQAAFRSGRVYFASKLCIGHAVPVQSAEHDRSTAIICFIGYVADNQQFLPSG